MHYPFKFKKADGMVDICKVLLFMIIIKTRNSSNKPCFQQFWGGDCFPIFSISTFDIKPRIPIYTNTS